MAEAKVLYLAGDTGNPPEWIEPDTEHLFLDETGGWSRMEGGAQAEPITCPIMTTDVTDPSKDFAWRVTVAADYGDVANALAFFVPNAGGSATDGGSHSAKFSDGLHTIKFARTSDGFPKVDGIVPFAFVGSDRCVVHGTGTTGGSVPEPPSQGGF